jgi:hypothetical protein
MGKSASAPPTPDYVGAAKQQGQDNLAAAKQSNIMSNPIFIRHLGLKPFLTQAQHLIRRGLMQRLQITTLAT